MAERRLDVRQETLDAIYTYMRRGLKERATDIHWEPFVENEKPGLVVRFRVDGLLKDIERLTEEKMNLGALTNAIKIMADLDPTKKRHHQDGRFTFRHEASDLDVRVATMPTLIGEKVVMRLMERSRYCMNLVDLGMTAELLESLKSIATRPEGFLIVSGPTGSGKTTTLYSILQMIYSREKNFCTVEDPVEVKFPGINQVQVDHEFGMTFVWGLRAIMRQDPNVIAVGEIRDAETVRISLQAALTGSMVFTTIHARDAINTIVRLLDMGVEPFFIANALTGVVSQRLVRIICKICKGKGCIQCSHTGFKKRTGLFEIVRVHEKMKELILRRASADELRAAAMEQGMIPFSQSMAPLLEQGLTTKEEVDRVLSVD